MSAEADRIKHERAKEQGRSCRRNGGKREANPYRRSPTLRDEADAWDEGFTEIEMERRARRG